MNRVVKKVVSTTARQNPSSQSEAKMGGFMDMAKQTLMEALIQIKIEEFFEG